MSNQPDILSTLALCRRAGKLEIGFDAVVQAARQGKAALVVTARDLSPKTRKELAFSCERHGVDIIILPADMDTLERLLGKRAGIFGIMDKGLAGKFKEA